MKLRILLAESDPDDTLFLQEVLTELEGRAHWSDWVQLEVQHAASWEEAEAILKDSSSREAPPGGVSSHGNTPQDETPAQAAPVDVALLDLNLYLSGREAVRTSRNRTSGGIAARTEVFRKLKSAAPHLPVVLLAHPEDIPLAEFLMREGAQDFLLKSQVDCAPLAHALRSAIERNRYLESARASAITDPLTGLLSREMFLALADRDLKLALGMHRRMLVVVGEAEDGASESPTAGRASADQVAQDQGNDLELVKIAEQLFAASAATDLLARIGERRFGIAIHETDQRSWEQAWDRLKTASVGMHVTFGAAVFHPDRPATLENLLQEAELELAPVAVAARR